MLLIQSSLEAVAGGPGAENMNVDLGEEEEEVGGTPNGRRCSDSSAG